MRRLNSTGLLRRIPMTATVKHGQVWDYRQGRYVTVTDVLDTVHGSSRLTGYVTSAEAIALCNKARAVKPRLELLK